MQSIASNIVVHACMVSMNNKMDCLWYVACPWLHVCGRSPWQVNAMTKTQNFKQLMRTPNHMRLIAKGRLNQPTTLFYAGVYPLQRSRIAFWQILAESRRPYEYCTDSGKNLKRPHAPKTQRNITKIVGHTRMGVINDKIIWLWGTGRLWRDRNRLLIYFDMFLRHALTPSYPKNTVFVQFLHN